jgi:hypothetical protein
MTRARALKEVIRARAARTGERYTTARRHVLNKISPPTASAVRLAPAPAAPPPSEKRPVVEHVAAKDAPAATRGGLSDAKALEKTGHGLDHWFDVLDRFGAVDKGHTQAARHLYEVHGVDGWYAQGITVAYERARGVRAPNQRCDGEYEVSVSKVIAARTADVIKALTEPRLRKRWVPDVDPQLAKALASALGSPASKGIVVRPDGQGRYRYKWGDTTVQLYLLPKDGGKVSLVATNSKLANPAQVEERRGLWRSAVNALAAMYGSSKKQAG